MKGLPPALRKKKRYVAFRVIAFGDFDRSKLIQDIWQSVISLYGEWYGNAGLRLEFFDENSCEGILRCTREKLEAVVAALTLINRAGGAEVAIKTLGVSGTIRGCKKYLQSFKARNRM